MAGVDDRVVRVFVSSTFRDMHAERDHLNRFIFPELRARCLRYGWDFLGVDLRWGITEAEADREGALALCLAEVDRCRPFFVGILGDRYGTVFPPELVPKDVFDRVLNVCTDSECRIIQAAYQLDETSATDVYRLHSGPVENAVYDRRSLADFWTSHNVDERLNAGRSITAAEIEYAALNPRTRVQHCFFYIRHLLAPDEPGIPAAVRPSLIEPAEQFKVRKLHEQVRTVSATVVRDYDATMAGIRLDPDILRNIGPISNLPLLASGALDVSALKNWGRDLRETTERHGVPELAGLETFGSRVLNDLWIAINAFIEEHALPSKPAKSPSRAVYQDAFVRQRARVFVGREAMLARLFIHVAGDSRSTLLVTGDPGSGKSALLANFASEYRSRHSDAVVATHFVGASPDSTSLGSMFAALSEQLGAPESEIAELPVDALRVRRVFQSMLRDAALNHKVIVIIDGLDQLEVPPEIAPSVWLPFVLPTGVHLIASSTQNQIAEVLKERLEPHCVVELEYLAPKDRRELLRQHLALRQKRLPDQFIERLLDDRVRADSRLPLYLLVAVEELCLFGSHDRLEARIASLPPTLADLLEQVLRRLEQDHGREMVSSVCGWLAVAHAGVTEPEMLDLLSRKLAQDRPIEWSWLYNAMQMYLYAVDDPASEAIQSGTLGFFVDQLRSVVFRRFLGMASYSAEPTDTYRTAHRELADYFYEASCPDGQHWHKDRARALAALPYHLVRAGNAAAAAHVLLNGSFLDAKAEAGLLFHLVRDLNEVSEVAGVQDRHTLHSIQHAVRSEIQFLARRPQSLFQTVWNYFVRADGDAVANGLRQVLDTWRSRKECERPGFTWIRSLLPLPVDPGGAEQMTLRGHQHVVFSVAFSPDGTLVGSGSRDDTVRVWSVETGFEAATLVGHRNQVQSLAFLDNERLLSGSGSPELRSSEGPKIGEHDYTVRLWSIPDEIEIACSPAHGAMIHTVAVSPDRECAVSGDSDGVLRVWPIDEWSNVQTVRAHQAAIRRVIYTATHILSYASNGEVGIWEPKDLVQRGTFSICGNRVWDMALSPKGKRLALAHEFISLLDAESGNEIRRIEAHGILGITWSNDGELLIGGLGDGSVRAWDAKSGSEVRRFMGHEGPVTCVAVSRDARRVASGSMDGTVRLWRLDSEIRQAQPLRHEATVLCIHPSQSAPLFISTSEDQTAIVWDATTGAIRSRFKGHTQSVTCAVLINNDLQAATGSYDDTIRFWDATTGQLLASFPGKCMGPNGIAVSPDGCGVSFSGPDGSVQTRDTRTRELRSTYTYSPNLSDSTNDGGAGKRPQRGLLERTRHLLHRRRAEKTQESFGQDASSVAVAVQVPHWLALAYSADGSTLAAGGLSEVGVWDVSTGDLRTFFKPPSGLFCLALSLRGDKIAIGSLGKVEVWDVDRRAQLHSLEGHTHFVSSVAFSPDARLVASSAEDGSARVWSAETGRCVGVIQGTNDIANLVQGARYIDRSHVTNETSFLSSFSGQVAGWFPGIVGMLRVLADGVSWAGMTRTGQIYILRVEGPDAPVTPLFNLLPLLTQYWRAVFYHHLRQNDRAKAAAVLAYREEVCREFGDVAGLEECASDYHHVTPPTQNTSRPNGRSKLEAKFEEIRTLIREEGASNQLLTALDEFEALGHEVGEPEGVRAALSLRMKVQMDESDDAGLLITLGKLAAINRELGDVEQLINALGTQTEVLQRVGKLREAVQLTFEMEELARNLRQLEPLVTVLRQRVILCRSANDLSGAVAAAGMIVQLGNDSHNLEIAQAGLGEQAFLYLDMKDAQSALRALDNQEQVCRLLQDPESLAVCLINSAVVPGRDKRVSTMKAKEAHALIEHHNLTSLKPKIGPVLAYLGL
jgi:WD40 repeat protein